MDAITKKFKLFGLLSKYDILDYMDFKGYTMVNFRDCNDLDDKSVYNLGFEISYGDGNWVTFREKV